MLGAFAGYGWPGNIRVIANVVERMVVLRRSGEIGIGDLSPQLGGATATCPSQAAAQLLGLNRTTLVEKLRCRGKGIVS